MSELDTSECPALLIGMGGTGIEVLKKLKRQFLKKTPDLLAENGGSVMFFAVDTEGYKRQEKHDPLKAGEYQSLGIGANPSRFVKNNLNSDVDFGIKTVWPVDSNGLPYELGVNRSINMGAAANRLIGRTALFITASKIFPKLTRIINQFFSITKVKEDEHTPPQIHVISSIAGGTGSSLIFDVPYLCKLAADDADRDVYMTGHFVMASAFQNVLKGREAKTKTMANTYTCLKEIDYLYRTHAENYGSGREVPVWEVRYDAVIGTVDAKGMPKDVAKAPPMTYVNLYHNQNECGIGVEKPDSLFDIISQAIAYSITGGINGKMLSANDNIQDKLSNLSSTNKAKPYSTLGVSSLELPIEALTQYLGYKWAETLARLKADNPLQSPKNEEEEDMLALMERWELEPLQKIAIDGCRVYREDNDSRKWEEIEGEEEIIQSWPTLAGDYGLVKFKYNFRQDIDQHIDREYKNRKREGKRFSDAALKALDAYKGELKAAAKEKLVKLKDALLERIEGLGDYQHTRKTDDEDLPVLRSLDIFRDAVGKLESALTRIIRQVGIAQQKFETGQRVGEQAAKVDNLNESKGKYFGFGGRSAQISDFTEGVKSAVTKAAAAEQARRLVGMLENLRDFLGDDIKTKVIEADGAMTKFIFHAKEKANTILGNAREEEREKAVSVFLIKSEQFPSFAMGKEQDLQARAQHIWKRTNDLIKEKYSGGKKNLIDVLHSGQVHIALGEEKLSEGIWDSENFEGGCLEKACLEAASDQLGNLDFQQFVDDEYLEQGPDKKEKLRQLLVHLDRKAGPWLTPDKEYEAGGFVDEVEPLDYILYPNGAQGVADFLEKMKKGSDFRGEPEIVEMPPNVTEGVVRISMRFGYTLESCDFVKAFKDCELAMLALPKQQLRSILDNYSEMPCPLDDYSPDKDMITLPTKDYVARAHLFIRAHFYGLLEHNVEAGTAYWAFIIEDKLEGTTKRVLPGKINVKLEFPKEDPESDIEFSLLREVYVQSSKDPAAIIKIAATLEDEDLKAAIKKAEAKYRNDLKKNEEFKDLSPAQADKKMLRDYAEGLKLAEIKESKRKAATVEEKFLRTLILTELGVV